MARFISPAGARAARVVLSFLGLFVLTIPASAQAPPEEAIANHLRAGEFAPALALAQQANPAQRDALLAQVAAAQAAAGMRRAGLATAASMSDDLARNLAIQNVAGQPVGNFGNLGGGVEPDFDAIIELIKTTIAPTTWDDVGGPGSVKEFEGGVRVDAQGVVHSLLTTEPAANLRTIRQTAASISENAQVRKASLLRKVSLPRLERLVQLRLAAGDPLDEDMALLAGLQKIQYVLVYPETGDLVLAGPAGDWKHDGEGRLVSAETGRPVLRLDDLVVLLRQALNQPGEPFGCSIVPLKENLARTQAFLSESSKAPLKQGQRANWLRQLREEMGFQQVEYYGIDPQTRIALTLFEADYRMKLVGIGLEPGTIDVPSYLSMVKVAPGESPPPLGVLRWWFTLNYDALLSSPKRDAFELRGQGVQVLSENELLTKTGERVHTGKSDLLTAEFARNFTKEFPKLAAKYPVYADLQNVFDLALTAALIQTEGLHQRVGWDVACFGDTNQFEVASGYAPRMVETVVNHRIVNKSQILAVASGGVRVDPARYVQKGAIQTDGGGVLSSKRDLGTPGNLPVDKWWWD
jgi:hypothetical protein